MIKYGITISLLLILICISCTDERVLPTMDEPISTEETPELTSDTIRQIFGSNYVQLPESAITISEDSTVWAQYAEPTERYTHGILGDRVEAGALVVAANNQIIELILDQNYVYEDIRPRLYDIDGDGKLEVITIRSHVDLGAGIAIYKIEESTLVEYAYVPEIGIRNRWLNVVAINDLDNDGIVELVWIETPHIGGILKVVKILEGKLTAVSEARQYSNHAIGETNLCLSVVVENPNEKLVYVPDQTRTKIAGFVFISNQLVLVDLIDIAVDFSHTLATQYTFENVVDDKVNCIE